MLWLAWLGDVFLLACLFVCFKRIFWVFWTKKSKIGAFFSNIPERTENITSECFLSAFKVSTEIFQEGYRAVTRQRSELCPSAAPGTPAYAVCPALMKFHRAGGPAGAGHFAAGLQAQPGAQNICTILAPLSAQRTTSFSLKPRGSLDKCVAVP